MAFATELTLTTGKTVYEGDPENGERIQSREVRVSVTYSLERQDGDPQVVALAKTPEVEETLAAAWRQIRAHTRGQATRQQVARLMAQDNTPPSDGDINDDIDDEQTDDEPDGAGGSTSPAPLLINGVPASGHCQRMPAHGSRLGSAAQDTLRRSPASCQTGDASPRRTASNGATTAGDAPTGQSASLGTAEKLTKPQLLAIRAACGRLRISEADAFQNLEEPYPIRRLELLTKADAAKMLHSLQQHEWKDRNGSACATP